MSAHREAAGDHTGLGMLETGNGVLETDDSPCQVDVDVVLDVVLQHCAIIVSKGVSGRLEAIPGE